MSDSLSEFYAGVQPEAVCFFLSFSLPITQLLLQPEHVSGVERERSGKRSSHISFRAESAFLKISARSTQNAFW